MAELISLYGERKRRRLTRRQQMMLNHAERMGAIPILSIVTGAVKGIAAGAKAIAGKVKQNKAEKKQAEAEEKEFQRKVELKKIEAERQAQIYALQQKQAQSENFTKLVSIAAPIAIGALLLLKGNKK